MSKTVKDIFNEIPKEKEKYIKISMDLAAQIKKYLDDAGMSQKDLADKLGKKESEISKWLSGTHNFTVRTLAKIETVFDKDLFKIPLDMNKNLFKNNVRTYDLELWENSLKNINIENNDAVFIINNPVVPNFGPNKFMVVSHNKVEIIDSNKVNLHRINKQDKLNRDFQLKLSDMSLNAFITENSQESKQFTLEETNNWCSTLA